MAIKVIFQSVVSSASGKVAEAQRHCFRYRLLLGKVTAAKVEKLSEGAPQKVYRPPGITDAGGSLDAKALGPSLSPAAKSCRSNQSPQKSAKKVRATLQRRQAPARRSPQKWRRAKVLRGPQPPRTQSSQSGPPAAQAEVLQQPLKSAGVNSGLLDTETALGPKSSGPPVLGPQKPKSKSGLATRCNKSRKSLTSPSVREALAQSLAALRPSCPKSHAMMQKS